MNQTYERAYDQAANRAHTRYMKDAREFALVLHNSCPLSDAFLSRREMIGQPSYLLDPERVERRVELDTQAAKALHQIWRVYMTNDADLTGREREIGKWLASIFEKAVDDVAEREAEGELEYGPDDRARRAGVGA